jgi:hypothetical protein
MELEASLTQLEDSQTCGPRCIRQWTTRAGEATSVLKA